MTKQKTPAKRRAELVEALEAMRSHLARAEFSKGLRAANPVRNDTPEQRDRENLLAQEASLAQGRVVDVFNAAVRAAKVRA